MLCKVCNSNDVRFFFKCPDSEWHLNKINFFKCRNCWLVFVHPAPKKEELSAYYVENYYSKPSVLLGLIRFLRKNNFSSLKPGNLLDVGCGNGSFLKIMQSEGWNCFGTETSSGSKKFAGELGKQGICVRHSELADAKFKPEFFDLITFWHVLEHLENPGEYIRAAEKLLKKNGKLFIAVPNIDSLSFRFWKCNWFHLDAPRHLLHFSEKSVSYLLEKNGFNIIKTSQSSFEFNPFGVLQSVYNSLGFSFNFLHDLLKAKNQVKDLKFSAHLLLTVLTLPVLLPLSIFLAYLFTVLSKGDTLQILAEKK